MLTVNSLSCERGERLLFKDLSFSLPPGEIAQITGKNGAGKSSLLKIIAGLARPLSGIVSWQNQTIEHDRTAYAALICYLGHLDGVKVGLSVAENLHFSRCLMQGSLNKEALAIQHLGLTQQANILVEDLSAGQKRRVALAQLLVSSAKLWILDEPFTSLDKQTITILERMFAEHCIKGGMIVVATHQPLNISNVPIQTYELV